MLARGELASTSKETFVVTRLTDGQVLDLASIMYQNRLKSRAVMWSAWKRGFIWRGGWRRARGGRTRQGPQEPESAELMVFRDKEVASREILNGDITGLALGDLDLEG